MISMIVAMNPEGAIGCQGKLPWHIPEDLAYFKEVTMGKPIIMGRTTFESIGQPLPGRTNIVLTRDESWMPKGVITASWIDGALEVAAACDCPEIMVIGGAEVYRQFLPMADRLYVTVVDREVVGADAWFPQLDEDEWDRTVLDKQVEDCEFWILDRKVKA